MLFGLLLALGAAPAGAHQLREVLTTVTWNPRAHALEVVHRIHLHEAIEAVARRFGMRDPDPGAMRNQARALLYVEERFALGTDRGPLELVPVGAELDGQFLFVYQEYMLPDPPPELRVESTVLMERYPDLRHQVNYEAGDRVITVVLRPGAERDVLVLPEAKADAVPPPDRGTPSRVFRGA